MWGIPQVIFSSSPLGSNLLTVVHFDQKDCIKAGKTYSPTWKGMQLFSRLPKAGENRTLHTPCSLNLGRGVMVKTSGLALCPLPSFHLTIPMSIQLWNGNSYFYPL